MLRSNALRKIFAVTVVISLLGAVAFLSVKITSAHPSLGNRTSSRQPAIVIGFVGGFIARDNPVHSEVQLAARLRREYSTNLVVETFESYHGEQARQRILALLDANHDGKLSVDEKKAARIIIYGHSWGGAECISLAKALQKDGIPVLLTIQVDSYSRPGNDDMKIPANVAQAVNFYQSHGIIRGHHDIHAADATRTKIVGNFRFDYSKSSLTCAQYPWYDRYIVKPHTQIECDPKIWDQVDKLIRVALLPQTPVAPLG